MAFTIISKLICAPELNNDEINQASLVEAKNPYPRYVELKHKLGYRTHSFIAGGKNGGRIGHSNIFNRVISYSFSDGFYIYFNN